MPCLSLSFQRGLLLPPGSKVASEEKNAKKDEQKKQKGF
jgi:hypothetical protein